jgi:type II secretion system protein J
MRIPRRAGFTLLEVLAVVLLMSLVLGVALDFFVDLSNASTHATSRTRELRHGVAVLDRVALDFERVLMEKMPSGGDALFHPWVFVAESRNSELGADRVKFIMRNAPTGPQDRPAADVVQVAYLLQRGEDGENFELRRWSAPHLPEGGGREFPPFDDALLLADGIAGFGVRFLDEATGEWKHEWDSTQLLESSELPAAVQIEVALAPHSDGAEPLVLTRQVLLPLRPLDMEALLDPELYGGGGAFGSGDGDGDGDSEGLTVADCVNLAAADLPDLEQGIVEQNLDTPWDSVRDLVIDRIGPDHPALEPGCP